MTDPMSYIAIVDADGTEHYHWRSHSVPRCGERIGLDHGFNPEGDLEITRVIHQTACSGDLGYSYVQLRVKLLNNNGWWAKEHW